MSSKQSSTDCALLVLSCDAYADLWPPFFTLLRRNWPDCPFPIYLGTGEASQAPAGVIVLRSDGGKDWSRCLLNYLDALPQSHVLLMLDDFFLRDLVLNEEILYCLRFAQIRKAIQLRLIPRPKPTDRLTNEKNIGISTPGSPYRLSTQAAIWDRRELRALLRENESIWEFEHNGNLRATEQGGGFYSVWRPVLPYAGWFAHHVVEKGRWLPHEKWIFLRQNVGCNFSCRRTLPARHVLTYHLAQTLDRALDAFSWQTKKRIKSWLKQLLEPYFHRQLFEMSGRKSDHRTPSSTRSPSQRDY